MNYAKAIFPYQTAVQDDLQLQVDDVVQVKQIFVLVLFK